MLLLLPWIILTIWVSNGCNISLSKDSFCFTFCMIPILFCVGGSFRIILSCTLISATLVFGLYVSFWINFHSDHPFSRAPWCPCDPPVYPQVCVSPRAPFNAHVHLHASCVRVVFACPAPMCAYPACVSCSCAMSGVHASCEQPVCVCHMCSCRALFVPSVCPGYALFLRFFCPVYALCMPCTSPRYALCVPCVCPACALCVPCLWCVS